MSNPLSHVQVLIDKLHKNLLMYSEQARSSVNELEISFNIDGVPLFSSSKATLWPILCSINLAPKRIFPVALSFGNTKPTDLEFLTDTVRDLNHILLRGISFDGKTIPVKVKCFICDAPAKAMVKAIKQYSGYYGCDRCDQKGLWMGRITYPEVTNLHMRSDEEFRNQTQDEHHRGVSPFCDLPIHMTDQFPIDYMHQVCLGVMKKLLLLWIRGGKEVRLSGVQQEQISSLLVGLKSSVPNVFARKPRALTEIDHWKATEYRQFLMYTGPVVLKGIMRDCLYNHFLILNTAIRILASDALIEHLLEYANQLLTYFVSQTRALYGSEMLVYNVHSLLHITHDVGNLGNLDAFSAFPFENYLHGLKRLVRSGKKPLAQRLGEIENNTRPNHEDKFELHVKKPNNSYTLKDGKCCEVLSVVAGNDSDVMVRLYDRTQPVFMTPCDSRLTGIMRVAPRDARIKIIPSPQLQLEGEEGEESSAVNARLESYFQSVSQTTVAEVEEVVRDFLKQAPHKRGGLKFKNPTQTRMDLDNTL